MTREELLSAVIVKLIEQLPGLTPEGLEKAYEGWELIPFGKGDTVEAVGMRQGTEIHWCNITSKPHVSYTTVLRSIRGLIDQTVQTYGYVTSRSMLESDEVNDKCEALLRRLGFKVIDTDKQFVYWILRGF